MSKIQDLHDEAMRMADKADTFRRTGEPRSSQKWLVKAFEAERKAAEACAADLAYEPTRSILHRSAASLAMEAGRFREAERLIAIALAGNPPDEIADELRDLLEKVYFDQPVRKGRRTLTGAKAAGS